MLDTERTEDSLGQRMSPTFQVKVESRQGVALGQRGSLASMSLNSDLLDEPMIGAGLKRVGPPSA